MTTRQQIRSIAFLAALTAFAPLGSAQIFSTEELTQRAVERRAVEAAIWGMPIVSVDAMRQGFFQNGGKYGDILFFSKPANWKFQVTTPNASSLYVYLGYDVKEGPWVLEFPGAFGAGLFGSINDAWQVPIVEVGPAGEDAGKGGKYLIIPPGFKGKVPAGYLPVRSATYSGYAIFRAIPMTRSDEDTARAIGLIKKLRFYPLAQAKRPPEQQPIDITGKLFDGIAHFDDSFYDSLARVVNDEPVQTRDLAMMGMLRALGIEKGKEFKPDQATRGVFMKAIAEAHAGFMEANTHLVPYWPGAKWGISATVGPKTQFTFQTDNYLDVIERGNFFYLACAPPKKLGKATFYLGTFHDAAGARLTGGKNYRLHVPPNVPAKQFWAVTVYDLETAGFIRDSQKIEVNSYQNLQKNADGSVDIYFGSKAPEGKESNWAAIAPGRPWFTFFRFYGPDQPLFDKTWSLPDIENVESR
jgi:hypothetical protein